MMMMMMRLRSVQASSVRWEGGLVYFAFDQGQTGHRRRKPTGIVTNLPEMSQLSGLRIQGGLGEMILASKQLSRSPSRCICVWWMVMELKFKADPQLRKIDMAAWRKQETAACAVSEGLPGLLGVNGNYVSSSKKQQYLLPSLCLWICQGLTRLVEIWIRGSLASSGCSSYSTA